MIRTLHPELLDTLPAHDASAIGSRRDLQRLNTLMSHAHIIARSLKKLFPNAPPSQILEIGAGDGRLLLRVAQLMNYPRRASLVDVLFIDLKNLLRDETKTEFASLHWRVTSIEADIFDWLKNSSTKTDVVLANLFLHHFTDAQLILLFSKIAEGTRAFIAVEPRRSPLPLFFAGLLGVIGCNAVTRHDAPISVRAGFTGRELSALWPRSDEWELTERRAGLFSHLFVARRKG